MFDAEALVVVIDTVDDTFAVDGVAETIPCMLTVVVAFVLDCASHIAMSLSEAGVGVGAGEGRGSCTGTGRGGRSGTCTTSPMPPGSGVDGGSAAAAATAVAGNTAERNTTEAPTDVAVGAGALTGVAAIPEGPVLATRLAAVAAAC